MKTGKYKILVTGGAGFIGSHIVDAYVDLGHKVVVLDNLSSGKKEFVNQKTEYVKADITDQKAVDKIFRAAKFDLVNHHAAQKSVTESVKDPLYDSKVNIKGSLVLLETCRKYQVKDFIFASTGGALYGETDILPTSEEAPIKPESPYGIAKFAVENYLRFYRSLGIRTKILRYGNVYGPRQDPYGEAGVVAIFCERAKQNKDLIIYGDGKQTRDFIYVDDVVEANMLSQNYPKSGVWNIGTGQEISVNTIAKKLIEISGKNINIGYQPVRLGELKRSCLYRQKAKIDFNWSNKTDLSDGLAKALKSFEN